MAKAASKKAATYALVQLVANSHMCSVNTVIEKRKSRRYRYFGDHRQFGSL